MYRVVYKFSDLQDNGHIYRPGDIYPRGDMPASDERIDALSTGNNKIGIPLIEKIAAAAESAPIEEEPKREKKTRTKKKTT